MIITIDGPAGSGKSTIAKELAKKLHILYVDSGAMFRAVTYSILQNKVELSNSAVAQHLKTISIKLEVINDTQETFLNELNVSKEIRSSEVTSTVSLVASLPAVRDWLIVQQRLFAQNHDLIMDGRDIGTIVFPNAECKFFLTASIEERAKRRTKEFEQKGIETSLEKIQNEIIKRDALDSNRTLAPLVKADDAVEIDTSHLTIEQVTNQILEIILKKRN
jgi:cytidylate kinase